MACFDNPRPMDGLHRTQHLDALDHAEHFELTKETGGSIVGTAHEAVVPEGVDILRAGD